MPIEPQQNIVQLQIPVNDTLGMEVLQRQQHLARIKLGLSEGELFLLNVQHQIPTRHILHDKVHPRLGLETRV